MSDSLLSLSLFLSFLRHSSKPPTSLTHHSRCLLHPWPTPEQRELNPPCSTRVCPLSPPSSSPLSSPAELILVLYCSTSSSSVKMGAFTGGMVGLTIGFIFGSFAVITRGAGPKGFLPSISTYMLSSGATFAFFMSSAPLSPRTLRFEN